MANNFLTAQQIARTALPILKSNLVFPLLTFNDYSDDFASFGDTIQVKKPPVYEANEFDGTIVTQDIKEDKILVTMDKIADVSVEVTAKEMALSVEDFSAQVIEPAAIAIAEKINRDGLALYKEVPGFIGTAGTTPGTLEAIAGARKALNVNKAPLYPRYGIWDPEADTELSMIPAIINAEKSGSTEALREGAIGRVQGMDNYMCQDVWEHTSQANAVNLTLNAATAEGDEVISLKGNTLTGHFVAGDLLVIDGVSYTVMADSDDAVANAIGDVKVYPALPQLNKGVAVELIGNHKANLAFHKNAFAFVSRPLELARGAESYVTSFEGLTLRVTFGYDVATKKQMLSIDTLYGFKTIYPQLAVRVLG